jgi:glyoxylase-like metal-dependent hydrolase (beta-lactamase superfamily II)
VAGVNVVPIPVKMGPMTVMAYLLVGERVIVLDTGVAGQAGRVLECLAREGRGPSDVSLILLTHGHGDHAGSAAALREATGAPIALGAGDEEKTVAGRDTEMHGRGPVASVLLRTIRRRQARSPRAAGPAPDLVIDSERSLREYGVDAVVVPAPGHTRGSLAVFTADGDALVGDLLGGGGRSRPKPRPGVFVSDEAAMDASIRDVLARRPRLTYTGHDEKPFSLEQLTEAFGRG